MAVRNGEPWISEAIDSVRRQTLSDFELIVVDDGSGDGTPQIVEALAAEDERIRLELRPAAGYPDALNTGWNLARADHLAVLDGDDLAEPGRLERQLRFLEEHPEVGVVGGALLLVTADGRPFYIAAYPEAPGDAADALRIRSPLGHTAVMMRRAVLAKVGGYRSDFPLAEDYDLWLRISERHAIANVPDIVGRYRVHGANGSLTGLRRQAASMAAARSDAAARSGAPRQPRDAEIAEAELELALWWAQIAARAGDGWRAAEQKAWRLAGAAARRTHDPSAGAARVEQARSRLDAQLRRRTLRRRASDLAGRRRGRATRG
jgi:hypothetical protein